MIISFSLIEKVPAGADEEALEGKLPAVSPSPAPAGHPLPQAGEEKCVIDYAALGWKGTVLAATFCTWATRPSTKPRVLSSTTWR